MRTKRRTYRRAGTLHDIKTNMPVYDVEAFESDMEIWNKLEKRFRVLETLTDHCLNGSARSLIVYGPAGLGKSYTCLLYTSPSPRDGLLSRMPSSA